MIGYICYDIYVYILPEPAVSIFLHNLRAALLAIAFLTATAVTTAIIIATALPQLSSLVVIVAAKLLLLSLLMLLLVFACY